jgi:hypothetical protein
MYLHATHHMTNSQYRSDLIRVTRRNQTQLAAGVARRRNGPKGCEHEGAWTSTWKEKTRARRGAGIRARRNNNQTVKHARVARDKTRSWSWARPREQGRAANSIAGGGGGLVPKTQGATQGGTPGKLGAGRTATRRQWGVTGEWGDEHHHSHKDGGCRHGRPGRELRELETARDAGNSTAARAQGTGRGHGREECAQGERMSGRTRPWEMCAQPWTSRG